MPAYHFPVLEYPCLWTPWPPQLPLLVNETCLFQLILETLSVILHLGSCMYVNTLCQELLQKLLLKAGQGLPCCYAL